MAFHALSELGILQKDFTKGNMPNIKKEIISKKYRMSIREMHISKKWKIAEHSNKSLKPRKSHTTP